MPRGVIDLAVTQEEKFLYVQNGTSGTVDGFRIGGNGSLTQVTTAFGPPPSPSPAWRAWPRCDEAAGAARRRRTTPRFAIVTKGRSLLPPARPYAPP
ncbi:hypothetical protein QFZ56_006063 [Streptomyces achromogenes]|uniref:Uncharacterized protein n=1 Tax=Streptomyces achromogenes TaxID=67255 RepID=A0ABU0Q8V8_STRAH|nr:hypothetical protein [Streptomyces achromogenes]